MKMKNKKQIQEEKRRENKERQRKNRRKETSLERSEKTSIPKKEKILIICEGENTEPSYFNQFKLSTADIKAIGKGYNTLSLVKDAIKLKEKKYKQTWCVFDKDDFKKADFNDAIKLAKKEGMKVAYSNQAFEYWLILHFEDHQGGAMHRNDYDKKINSYINPLGSIYDGKDSKLIEPHFFDLMLATDPITKKRRVDLAIKRAKEIFKNKEHISPATEESSTTVYELVEEILKFV